MNWKFSTLLAPFIDCVVDPTADIRIDALTNDSRQANRGSLFVAVAGETTDGRKYIKEALAQGAAVVYDLDQSPFSLQLDPSSLVIGVKNLRARQGELAARFYQNPTAKMTMIGVTGTNGKSSISHYIAQALQPHHVRCGIIGTLGYGFLSGLIMTEHTTPDPFVLQRACAEIYAQGAQAIAMEVSSIALMQDRTSGVEFDIAILTQLTREHLDYHGTMENYAQAKKRLFYSPGLRYAVLNADDQFGKQLLLTLKKPTLISYSLQSPSQAHHPDIYAKQIEITGQGFHVEVVTPWGSGEFKTGLLGRFNLSNLFAVLATLCLMGIQIEPALSYLNKCRSVMGRMQKFGGENQPTVVVDYSHTPDALKNALLTLRHHHHKKLWCIFGCGGERDRGKRPEMAKIADELSDHVIITNDNPRREDPKQILADILRGISPQRCQIELDRARAIAYAVQAADNDDIILVAGKGHEDYQIIGDQKIHFSDIQQVSEALSQRALKEAP